METVNTIAIDIAKRTFSLYWVDPETGEVTAKALTRAKFEDLLRTREPSRIVFEAGGSAHYWARWLSKLGHDVRLIAPQHVRPFVRTNKTDGADARAIWEAARRPEVKWIPVKSEASQAVLALHRVREQLVHMRIMQNNQIKALLYEFGIVPTAKVTVTHIDDWIEAGRLPKILGPMLHEQLERIWQLKRDEVELTATMERQNEHDELATRLLDIPGIGVLGASALAAELTEGARSYTNGRQFAACKGIAPRLRGTGGKVHMGRISKRGDPYVRTLLIHGARSVILAHRRWAKRPPSPWLKSLLDRRPVNVAAVALANKMARTAWAIAAHGRTYQQHYGAQTS